MPLTLCLNSTPVAQDFTPAQPPSVNILATWIMVSRAAWKPAELRDALATGQPVELVKGEWLEWREQEL